MRHKTADTLSELQTFIRQEKPHVQLPFGKEHILYTYSKKGIFSETEAEEMEASLEETCLSKEREAHFNSRVFQQLTGSAVR